MASNGGPNGGSNWNVKVNKFAASSTASTNQIRALLNASQSPTHASTSQLCGNSPSMVSSSRSSLQATPTMLVEEQIGGRTFRHAMKDNPFPRPSGNPPSGSGNTNSLNKGGGKSPVGPVRVYPFPLWNPLSPPPRQNSTQDEQRAQGGNEGPPNGSRQKALNLAHTSASQPGVRDSPKVIPPNSVSSQAIGVGTLGSPMNDNSVSSNSDNGGRKGPLRPNRESWWGFPFPPRNPLSPLPSCSPPPRSAQTNEPVSPNGPQDLRQFSTISQLESGNSPAVVSPNTPASFQRVAVSTIRPPRVVVPGMRCDLCFSTWRTDVSLLAHKRTKHGAYYVCSLCPRQQYTTTRKTDVLAHFRQVHGHIRKDDVMRMVDLRYQDQVYTQMTNSPSAAMGNSSMTPPATPANTEAGSPQQRPPATPSSPLQLPRNNPDPHGVKELQHQMSQLESSLTVKLAEVMTELEAVKKEVGTHNGKLDILSQQGPCIEVTKENDTLKTANKGLRIGNKKLADENHSLHSNLSATKQALVLKGKALSNALDPLGESYQRVMLSEGIVKELTKQKDLLINEELALFRNTRGGVLKHQKEIDEVEKRLHDAREAFKEKDLEWSTMMMKLRTKNGISGSKRRNPGEGSSSTSGDGHPLSKKPRTQTD